MTLTLDPTTERAKARKKHEDEVRAWFQVLCDCIRNRDREGLRVAARELADRGVGFPAENFLREVRP